MAGSAESRILAHFQCLYWSRFHLVFHSCTRMTPQTSTCPCTTYGDIDGFIVLLEVAFEDAAINATLQQLLSC